MAPAGVWWTPSGQMPLFHLDFQPLSFKKRPRGRKYRVLPLRLGSPTPPPDFRHPSRGFGHVGRCGPETGASGNYARGKIRYFRYAGCSFPEREARSVLEPANPIEESGPRVSKRGQIYAVSEQLDFRTDNTIEDEGSHILDCACVCVEFGNAIDCIPQKLGGSGLQLFVFNEFSYGICFRPSHGPFRASCVEGWLAGGGFGVPAGIWRAFSDEMPIFCLDFQLLFV